MTRNGEHTTIEHLAHPKDGTTVLDTATGKVGVISGQQIERISWSDEVVERLVWLAPPGGGYHWTTAPASLAKPSA